MNKKRLKKLFAMLLVFVLILMCSPLVSHAAITDLDVTPLNLDFGTQSPGYNQDALIENITIKNTGSITLIGPMKSAIIGADSTAFVIHSGTGYPDIPSGETRTIQVKPAANLYPGSYAATLQIMDMLTSSTQAVALIFAVSGEQPSVALVGTAPSGTAGSVGERVITVAVSGSHNEAIAFTADINGIRKSVSRSGNGNVDFMFTAAELNALAAGDYPIMVSSAATTNNHAIAGTQVGSLKVNAAPTLTGGALPNGTVDVGYSQSIAGNAGGGTTPYSFALDGTSSLPAGLQLATDGTISGTPTAAVTNHPFDVTLTDNSGLTAAATYTLTVNAAPDTTAPVLSAGTARRIAERMAEVSFESDEAGTYYWQIDGTVPTAASLVGGGAMIPYDTLIAGTNTKNHANLSTYAHTIYIAAEDAAGNISNLLTIPIPAYTPPAQNHDPQNPPGTTTPMDTSKDQTITFNGDWADVADIRLDGISLIRTAISADAADLSGYPNYNGVLGNAKKSSVAVTLYKEFLQWLPNGVYNLEVEFNDGGTVSSGAAQFLIRRDAQPTPTATATAETTSPKTGDENNISLWIALCMIAGVSIVGAVTYRRRRYGKQ
jgi:LPXTG-motif cell wall-anchored protein